MTEPNHRRGAVVDEAILNATLEEIAAIGSFAIRVDRVAERIGVNKTTIYRRFPTVDELVLASVLRRAEEQVPMPDTGVLRDDLNALATMVRDAINDPFGRALLAAGADIGPYADLRRAFWSQRLETAGVLFDRAAERGDIAPIADAAEWVERLVAPIHFRVSQIGGEASDDFLASLVERVLGEIAQ